MNFATRYLPPMIAAIAASLACVACGDDDPDKFFLGPIGDAGIQPADVQFQRETGQQISVATLSLRACETDIVLDPASGTKLQWLSVLDRRALIVTDTHIWAYQLDADGCGIGAIQSFGTMGKLELAALSASPLPGGRSLVASASGVRVLSPLGEIAGECLVDSAPVVARAIDMLGEAGYGIFSRSPVTHLATTLNNPGACDASPVQLASPPMAIAAIAQGKTGGFITLEQADEASKISVVRRDAAGQILASWSPSSSDVSLCSANAAIETDTGVWVADGACNTVWLIDSASLVPKAKAQVSNAPRGIGTLAGVGELVADGVLTSDGLHVRLRMMTLP